MNIYLTINSNNRSIDISFSNENKISTVLEVLLEKSIIFEIKDFVLSKRLQRKIPTYLTFEEARIQTGDILYV